MTAVPPVNLKYFDARGRGQFIRYFLTCRGVSFTDDRVPLSADFAAWAAIRGDRALVGPFHKLPVLRWGDIAVAETMVIQSFLHRQLGDEARLSDEENLRHAMLVSTLYVDVMMPLGILLWSEVMFPGGDLAASAKRTLDRIKGHFDILDRTLGEWSWLERAAQRPVMIADCMFWEELSVMEYVFREHYSVEATPRLARFYREFAGRAVCERLLAQRPCQVTGRPGEADVVARIIEGLGKVRA